MSVIEDIKRFLINNISIDTHQGIDTHTARGVQLLAGQAKLRDSASRYTQRTNNVIKYHPHMNSLREYARTLDNPKILPHYAVAHYTLMLDEIEEKEIMKDLIIKVYEVGGYCDLCYAMYKKSLRYKENTRL